MKEMGLPYRQAKMTVRNPEAAERLKILLKKYKAVPVPSPVQLDAAAAALLACGPVLRPTGIQSPRKVELASSGCFYRDPMVRAWTLQRSGGKCECCARPAPFVDSLGMPFLESHHILPLSHGGPDVPLNTAAVCPNCHRELHHGQRKAAMTETLQELVTLAEDRWLSTVMS
jgi:5-methylcytosine-specific restriction protein A